MGQLTGQGGFENICPWHLCLDCNSTNIATKLQTHSHQCAVYQDYENSIIIIIIIIIVIIIRP